MADQVPKVITPPQDPEIKAKFAETLHTIKSDTSNQFFKIWDKLLEKGVAKPDSSLTDGFSVFTVSDFEFNMLVPQDISNPFILDPWLQRLVLNTQLVPRNIKPGDFKESENTPVKTVGNARTIDLRKLPDGSLTANDIKVKHVFEGKHSTVYILEKIMWIRPEDIESAMSRIN